MFVVGDSYDYICYCRGWHIFPASRHASRSARQVKGGHHRHFATRSMLLMALVQQRFKIIFALVSRLMDTGTFRRGETPVMVPLLPRIFF